jgi:hypothetical protein
MNGPTWDMLIATIPHRDASLRLLLAELDRQLRGYGRPRAGVRIYRDNLEHGYGNKTQDLINSSTAGYISCIDDDDMVAPDFVERVLAALGTWPDYVGFPVRWTVDGVPQCPVEHSLRHGGWHDSAGMLKRDIAQFNPIRRELALLGTWEGGYQAERRWGDQVRATGRVATEVWIDEPMYYYQDSPTDTFMITRQPFPPDAISPLPSYPWLTAI